MPVNGSTTGEYTFSGSQSESPLACSSRSTAAANPSGVPAGPSDTPIRTFMSPSDHSEVAGWIARLAASTRQGVRVMAVGGNGADLVFTGGEIRTPAHPSGFVQALAVRGGVIQALGRDDEIRELTGRRTRVIDLRGRLTLPAFGDAHVHAVAGGLESLRCNLLGLRTRHQCLAAVGDYCSARPDGGWVLGGGWTMSAFPGGLPTAADLDPVTGGRPAFLPNRDHHSAWVNTAALTLAGIDENTPDPVDGRIERDLFNPAQRRTNIADALLRSGFFVVHRDDHTKTGTGSLRPACRRRTQTN